MVVAAHEASIMLDAQRRASTGAPDPLAADLRTQFSRTPRGRSAPTLESILAAWKRHVPGVARVVGAFLQTYQFRHWLAHGRYFPQTSGLPRLDPLSANARGEALGRRLGLSRR
jgi:hypothetical protein